MGTTDKVIRIMAAIAMGILYFTNVVSGVPGLVLLGMAVIFMVTSLINFCPLYLPFGIKTLKKKL
jgi:hypothetical protein